MRENFGDKNPSERKLGLELKREKKKIGRTICENRKRENSGIENEI